MSKVPLKPERREKKLVQAWVPAEDAEALKEANANIPEIIRRAVRDAAERLRDEGGTTR